jgi:benzylsuccinate CoA-transferase BbsE subunit
VGGTQPSTGALAGLRVLDLSTRYGWYSGRLFAGMGADVILVEPPGSGCALRAEPPFLPGGVDSIPFFHTCAGKRGMTLDLNKTEGRGLLAALARTADLVIEDEAPGALAAIGLGHADLARANPRLSTLSISPFGQSGPYAAHAADDLVLLALGGFLNMMGYPDAAPTRPYGRQAEAIGCMFGAVGAMVALFGREATGRGQHIDIAIQECVTMALENAAQFHDLEGSLRTRFGGAQRQAGTGMFACADGYIYLFAGGMAAIRFWGNLVQWMRDEAVPGAEALAAPEWSDMAFLNSVAAKDRFEAIFSRFAAVRTKAVLYHEGQARRVPLCPVSTPEDVAGSRQLADRGFFETLRHAASGLDVVMPGAPFQLSGTPWRMARPAPGLGEHNADIYAELGVDTGALRRLAAEGVI